MERIPIGVAHGRFQPPHNGHVRYLLAAFVQAEHVLVGIATPKLCTEEEAARTGWPCTAALNPFSFAERKGMITAALNEAGVSPDRYSFVDFPSDYAHVESIVPAGATFFMSVTGTGDTKKIEHLKSLGYAVETVMEIPEDEEREHSGGVRESAKAGTAEWQSLVPDSVRAYMEEHGLIKKLK